MQDDCSKTCSLALHIACAFTLPVTVSRTRFGCLKRQCSESKCSAAAGASLAEEDEAVLTEEPACSSSLEAKPSVATVGTPLGPFSAS